MMIRSVIVLNFLLLVAISNIFGQSRIVRFHSLDGRLENEDVLNLSICYSTDSTVNIEVFVRDSLNRVLYQAIVPELRKKGDRICRDWRYYDFQNRKVLKDLVDIGSYAGLISFEVALFNELNRIDENNNKIRIPISEGKLEMELLNGSPVSDFRRSQLYNRFVEDKNRRNGLIDSLDLGLAYDLNRFEDGDEKRIYFRNWKREPIVDTLLVNVYQKIDDRSFDTLYTVIYPKIGILPGNSVLNDYSAFRLIDTTHTSFRKDQPIEVEYVFKNHGRIRFRLNGKTVLKGKVRLSPKVRIFDPDKVWKEYSPVEFSDSTLIIKKKHD